MKTAALLTALLLCLPGLAGAAPDVDRLEAELEEVARRIEVRKRAARDSLLPDGELEKLLQRSQELAAQLNALRGSAPRKEAGAAPVDDPDDIREKADLLRDERDRVVAQLRVVADRIEEAREEELLARELRDFVDEGDLFDDGERIMRAARTVRRTVEVQPGAAPGGDFDEGLGMDSEVPASPAPGAGPTRAPVPVVTSQRVTGTRPLGGAELGRRGLPPLAGDESVDELLERQQVLQQLAAELASRADELEHQARELAAPDAR